MAWKRARRRRKGKLGIFGFVLLLLFLLVFGLLLSGRIFVVRTINVVGTHTLSPQDIVKASGIQIGKSIFKIDRDQVERQFDLVGQVGFEGIETQLPSTVVLQVRERTPRVIVNYAGLPTVLDEYGFAMEQARELPDLDLPNVHGLRANSCQVGRRISSEIPNQVDYMNAVVQAIYSTQVYPVVSELNISDLDNMYLMLKSGLMVKIGDATNLQNKLLLMASVLNQPEIAGIPGGALNVSGGTSVVYEPSNEQRKNQQIVDPNLQIPVA